MADDAVTILPFGILKISPRTHSVVHRPANLALFLDFLAAWTMSTVCIYYQRDAPDLPPTRPTPNQQQIDTV